MSEREAYIKSRLEGHRETLRNAPAFTCASCGKVKPHGEAAGVHLYETDDPALQNAMMTSKGPRVGTYAICLECVDSLPEKIIHQNVTRSMAKDGLFAPEK